MYLKKGLNDNEPTLLLAQRYDNKFFSAVFTFAFILIGS